MYIGVDGTPKRWKVDALMALQYAAETYLTNIFADAYESNFFRLCLFTPEIYAQYMRNV